MTTPKHNENKSWERHWLGNELTSKVAAFLGPESSAESCESFPSIHLEQGCYSLKEARKVQDALNDAIAWAETNGIRGAK
jgi:hypothetical protein